MKNRILYVATLAFCLMFGYMQAQTVPAPKTNLELNATSKQAATKIQEVKPVTKAEIPTPELKRAKIQPLPSSLPAKVYAGASNATTGKTSVEKIIQLKTYVEEEN